LAKRAKELEKEIEEFEDVLKERKEQQRKLLEDTIPGMLNELGMKSFKMADGSQDRHQAFLQCKHQGREQRAQAYEWLREKALTTSSRTRCQCGLVVGKTNCARALLNLLREQNYPVEQAQKIEPQTLKAWVREMVERGSEFPTELFGAYVGQKATIKSA
jgi:hypothetical protein